MSPVDIAQQFVVVARLGDVCRFGGKVSGYETDPWLYMRTKLSEIEAPIQSLKRQQLDSAKGRFLKELAQGVPGEEALAEFRSVLERYLGPGDFVDAAMYLNPVDLADAKSRKTLEGVLAHATVHSLFDEERKPAESRARSHEKRVGELWSRLGLDALERALARKPKTERRRRMVLRRLRRSVAEYCSVLHVPTTPEDTFSPFMLHRVEALTVACLRLLDKHRS